MTTRALFVVACTLLMLIVSLSGCGSKAKESSPESATTSGTAAPVDGTDRQASDMQKMKAELAKLTSSDAASAAKQHHCPVSGKMLGTMGAPRKLTFRIDRCGSAAMAAARSFWLIPTSIWPN